DVREVVRDVVDILLLGAHPAGGCIQRANHLRAPFQVPVRPADSTRANHLRPSSVMAPRSTSFMSTVTALSSVSKLRVTSDSSATRSTTDTFDCSSEPGTTDVFSTTVGATSARKREPPSLASLVFSPNSTIFNL